MDRPLSQPIDALEQLETAQSVLAAFQGGRRDFSGVDLTNADLSGADLSGINLAQANLRGTNLAKANLTEANLTGADLHFANLNCTTLRSANLTQCNLQQATLQNVDWYRVNLSWANLTCQVLSGADLRWVDFQGANLSQADLSTANLSEAKLDAANLQAAILTGANLQYAYLPYAQLTQADLQQAELTRADLTGANLENCTLIKANLRGARLRKANLAQANLCQTYLNDCNLQLANLTHSNLQKADLTQADLKGAILEQTDLRGAEFEQAKNLNLEGAKVGALTQTITPLLHLELETRQGTSFAFSPDSQTLAYVSRNNTIILIDVNTGEQQTKISIQPEAVVSVVFSSDGQRIEESFYVNELKLWNALTGECVRELKHHSANLTALALNGDAEVIGMTGTGEPFEVFDIGHETRTLRGYSKGIQTQAHSPDGKWTARSGPELDGQIELLDRQTQQRIHHLTGHAEAVQSLAFSPDSQTLASYSAEDFKLWTVGDPKPTFSTRTSQLTVFPFVAFTQPTQTERSVLVTSHFFSIFSYREPTIIRDKINWNARGGSSSRSGIVALSGDRRVLARYLDDQSIQIWDLQSGREHAAVNLDSDAYPIALNSNGTLLAAGNAYEIEVWNIFDARKPNQRFVGHSDTITSIVFNSDNKLVASGGWDCTIKLWDYLTGTEFATFQIYSRICALAFSPIDAMLVSLSQDGTIKFWDLVKLEEIHSFKAHNDDGEKLTLSPDGQYVASCDRKTIRVWKLEHQ